MELHLGSATTGARPRRRQCYHTRMDLKLEDYATTGETWPIYVRREHVEAASRSGAPARVFPRDTVAPSAFAERPRSRLGAEVGYTGIPLSGGEIDLDANLRLTPTEWRGSYDEIGIVDRMVREDPVAQAIRMAWTLPLLSIPWLIEPASDDPKDIEVADFVEAALFEHLRGGFESWLEQAVQFTWRGWALFEIVARFDKVLQRTVIDRLAPRMPWTIYEWLRYRDGRWGCRQYPYSGDSYENGGTPSSSRMPSLAPEKLLHLTYQPDGNNPEPMGILRPCYGAWRQRRTYLKLEATGFERAAYGIPYVEVDVGASPGDIEQVNIILRELRSGIRSFAMFPRGYTLQFAEFPMKAADIREARKSAGHDMARAALCQFLFTGEQAGAYSLIQGQLDHYTMALQQAGNRIASTLGQGPNAILKRLVSWNFEGVDEYPTISAGEVRVGDPKQLVKTAVDAGALFPDAQVEAKVRTVLSLPAKLESSNNQDVGPEEPEEPTPKASPPSGEESERGEKQEEQEQEAKDVQDVRQASEEPKKAWRKSARPFPPERLLNDQIVVGPKGRGVRPIEGVVRFSETRGTTSAGAEEIGEAVLQWRQEVAPAYAAKVAQAKSLPEAMLVKPPRLAELRRILRDGLEGAYSQGRESAKAEIQRQKDDPDLQESLKSGDAYRTDTGVEPGDDFVWTSHATSHTHIEGCSHQLELTLAKIEKPRSAPGMGPSTANVAPAPVTTGVADSTAILVEQTMGQAGASALQVGGIGGTLPATVAAREALVLEAINLLSDKKVINQAAKDFKTIFGLGRIQEQRAEGIQEYMFSNLAESDTCYICDDLDGHTFGEDELNDYATPYWNCEGGDNCNCLVIGILKEGS